MMHTLNAELKKLLTVRSTYVYISISIAMVLFYAGYVTGYKASSQQLIDHTFLSEQVLGAISFVTTFAGFVVLLLVAHEYRYSTIIYTLTLSKSRTRVLVAKVLAATIFLFIFAVVVAVLSPLATVLGAHLHGHHFNSQNLNVLNLLWRSLFYCWGYGMYAVILATILRNQIGAIVALLVTPIVAEGILGLLLKHNAKYLPFTALGSVVQNVRDYNLTPVKAASIASVYILVGFIVSWVLFVRRDAN